MRSSKNIEEYLPLIRSVINTYAYGKKVLQEDLEQEGFLAILDAQEKFDSTKGTKFETYAYFWVKKRILAYLGREVNYCKGRISQDLESTCISTEDVTFCRQGDDLLQYMPEEMPADERQVMELCFGECLSLSAVARQLRMSCEKVRRIKFKALRRIKSRMQLKQ